MTSSLGEREQAVGRLTVMAAAVAMLWLAPPASMAAQESDTLAVAARVRARVAPSGQAYTGSIAALRNDTLVLDRGQRGVLAVPLASVVQLERSRGPGWCRRRPGARLGCIALGIVSGAVIGGVISYQATKCDDCDLSGIGVIFGVPVGAGVGLIVGALVGGERWERVPVPGSTGPR